MFGGSALVVKQFGFSRLVGVCGIVWSRQALLGLLGLYLRCPLGVYVLLFSGTCLLKMMWCSGEKWNCSCGCGTRW